jgi:GDP-L-fucose synthase
MTFYDGKSIVVLGGYGFLGSHISKKLSNYDCRLFISSQKNGVDFRRFDSCLNYLQNIRPDIIFNCVGDQGGIGYYENREGQIYLDNLLMGTYLMEAARIAGAKKYVNIVPNCSYPGHLSGELIREEDFWDGPLHNSVLSYGFSKKAPVIQGWSYAKQYHFNSIHLILTNMYGPGDHFDAQKSHALGALLLKFYEAKKNHIPSVEVWGTGEAIREWLYVEDAADAVIRAGEKYDELDPLNIAVGSGISISELAEIIKRITRFEGKIIYNKNRPSGAKKKVLSVSKMQDKLKWTPETPIETGIGQTLRWLEEHYDTVVALQKSQTSP